MVGTNASEVTTESDKAMGLLTDLVTSYEKINADAIAHGTRLNTVHPDLVGRGVVDLDAMAANANLALQSGQDRAQREFVGKTSSPEYFTAVCLLAASAGEHPEVRTLLQKVNEYARASYQ